MDNKNYSSNYDVSIKALSEKTLDVISALLNPIKYILTENNLPRYWKGLAHLCEIGGEYMSSIHESDSSKRVLGYWNKKDPEGSTINQLIKYLEILDRFDIIDDITPLLENDVKLYQSQPPESTSIDLSADEDIITTQDAARIKAGLPPLDYDAFVLFAQKDVDFATELIETMEKQYEMRFCYTDRDILGGASRENAIRRLITKRCNRLIVILSQEFFSSDENRFFLSYAQQLEIGKQHRKVIPCIYKENQKLQLPDELKFYFLLDYTRSGRLWNFWDKLRDSIRAPLRYVENESNQYNICNNSTHLKAIDQSGNFISMVNLNENGKRDTISSVPSTTSLPNSNETEKVKSKNWLNRLFRYSNKKSKIGPKKRKRKTKILESA